MKGYVFTALMCSVITLGVCHAASSNQDIEKMIDELSRPRGSGADNKSTPKGATKGYELIYQTRKSSETSGGTQHKEIETPSQGVIRVETNVQTWPSAMPATPVTSRYHYSPPPVPALESLTYGQEEIVADSSFPLQVKTQTQISPPGARSSRISGMMVPRMDDVASRQPVSRTKTETSQSSPVYVETETVTSPAPYKQYSIIEGSK